MRKRITICLVCSLLLISVIVSSCSFFQQQPKITYDPNKTYAAFLVLEVPPARPLWKA